MPYPQDRERVKIALARGPLTVTQIERRTGVTALRIRRVLYGPDKDLFRREERNKGLPRWRLVECPDS